MKTSTMIKAAALLAFATGSAYGQCGLLKFTPGDAANSDFFGGSLAMSFNDGGAARLLVGVGSDDTAAGVNAGSVKMFGRINNQWGEFDWMPIMASDGQTSDFFGVDVGFSDPRVIVGATGVGSTGAVYLFNRFGSAWDEEAKIVPLGSASGDDTGRAVDIDGDFAIFGAPLFDFGGTHDNAGRAFIYRHNANGTWSHEQTIVEPEAFRAAGDHMGAAVAISGNMAVVGAPLGEGSGHPLESGYVRTYVRDEPNTEWDAQQFITPPSDETNDQFGASVDMDGNYMAIGAPNRGNFLFPQAGAVFIYRYDIDTGIWELDGTLVASDLSNGGHFGESVSIVGTTVAITADGDDKVYLFRRAGLNNWAQDAVLTDPDGPDSFATDVAFNGSELFVGDQGDDQVGLTNAGAVYLHNTAQNHSDSCEGAKVVVDGEYAGCTTFATRDGATTCGSPNAQGPDVWFRWTPECAESWVIFDTFGSDFDTVLSVHGQCGGSDTTLHCNDDGFGGPGASLVTFTYTPNTTYYIRIAGYNGAIGNYNLRIVTPQPVNDTCAAAIAATAGTYTGCTQMANSDGDTDCGLADSSPSVWYSYTAACNGSVTMTTTGSTYDTVLSVHSACPGSDENTIACDDDGGAGLDSVITFNVQAGQSYKVRVSGYSGNSGQYTLNVGPLVRSCPADTNCNGVIGSNDITAFLQLWFADLANATLHADFNQSGSTGSADITAFLQAWFAAVQNGC
ncbi:MAG: hypothetical protein H7Y88_09920 [Phycisphaerales bacterium]|nr:hypothetical protein [Phycisphaerales bacterium]